MDFEGCERLASDDCCLQVQLKISEPICLLICDAIPIAKRSILGYVLVFQRLAGLGGVSNLINIGVRHA